VQLISEGFYCMCSLQKIESTTYSAKKVIVNVNYMLYTLLSNVFGSTLIDIR